MIKSTQVVGVGILLALAVAGQSLLGLDMASRALALGLAAPPHYPMRAHVVTRAKKKGHVTSISHKKKIAGLHGKKSKLARGKRKLAKAAPKVPVPLPQSLVESLSSTTVAPGVVYKSYKGPISINVIEADLMNAPVAVRPVIAQNSYHRLADVKSQAQQSNAIAAVNANYFKKDGTPLGTLILDKEWVSGPLYGRVSLGITRCGFVRIDCVDVHGTLTTSNPDVACLWVNNINQPRRSGCHVIAYTRRWGDRVVLPYAGCLVAVDASGHVIDKKTTIMDIPRGGFVLSDAKNSQISKLKTGDEATLGWHTTPDTWSDVVQAVSGGPMLLKNGQLYVDLNAEKFKKAWTSSSIKARTAAGVTANNHLLLVTVEGPHTLWDMAKLLQKLGAVEAMNLDGGGSTTMVVHGKVVTRNATSFERRVASALTLVPASTVSTLPESSVHRFCPKIIEMPETPDEQAESAPAAPPPAAQQAATPPVSALPPADQPAPSVAPQSSTDISSEPRDEPAVESESGKPAHKHWFGIFGKKSS